MMTPGHRLSITPTLLTMQSLHVISVGASLSHQIMMMAKSPQHAIPNNNNNNNNYYYYDYYYNYFFNFIFGRVGVSFFFTFPFFFFLFDFLFFFSTISYSVSPTANAYTMFFPIYMMTIEVSPVVLGSPIQSFGLKTRWQPTRVFHTLLLCTDFHVMSPKFCWIRFRHDVLGS